MAAGAAAVIDTSTEPLKTRARELAGELADLLSRRVVGKLALLPSAG